MFTSRVIGLFINGQYQFQRTTFPTVRIPKAANSMLFALTLIHSMGQENVKQPIDSTSTVSRTPSLTRPKPSNSDMRHQSKPWAHTVWPSDDFHLPSSHLASFYGFKSAVGTQRVLVGHPTVAGLNDMTIDGLDYQNFSIPVGTTAMRIAASPTIVVIPRAPAANITVIASNGSVVATLDDKAGDFAAFFASETGWVSIEASTPLSLEYYSIPLWPWDCSSVYLSTSPSEKFVGSGGNATDSGGNFSLDQDDRVCFVHVSDSMTRIVAQVSLLPSSDFLHLRGCDWAREISYSGMEESFVARRSLFLGMRWQSGGSSGSGGFFVSVDSPESSLPERRARVTTLAESVQILRHPGAALGVGANESSGGLDPVAIVFIVLGCILVSALFVAIGIVVYLRHLKPPPPPENHVSHDGTEDLGIRTLYHETSHQAAMLILESRRMMPGPRGMFGPGIYFAPTPESAHNKTLHQGQILVASVDLGRTLILRQPTNRMDLDTVTLAGCQSVTGQSAPNRPWEYVVYESARVIHVRSRRRLIDAL
jgi:hypothetical protein